MLHAGSYYHMQSQLVIMLSFVTIFAPYLETVDIRLSFVLVKVFDNKHLFGWHGLKVVGILAICY